MWAHELVGTKSAGRAHPANPWSRRAGSGWKSQASGSLREQSQLLSICQALTAHEGHVRRTCQKSESRRVILCVPIQLKIEAAPGTSVYCQGDEYLYHATDGLVHHYSLKMAALRMYLWELPAPVWAGNGGGHQPALLAQLTAGGLSAPSHASTYTSVDGLDMDFRTLHHTSSDSALLI